MIKFGRFLGIAAFAIGVFLITNKVIFRNRALGYLKQDAANVYRDETLQYVTVTSMEDRDEDKIKPPSIVKAPMPGPRPLETALVRKLQNDDPGRFLGNGTISPLFEDISITEAQGLFHGQMTKVEYNCPETRRFGSKGDGGYTACVGGAFTFKKNDCLVYSFGIGNNWSFDEAMNDVYGCEVHSFDPTIGREDHMHRPNMYFYNMGLWGHSYVMPTTKGWIMKDLSTIMRDLKHENRIIDYLKIDVEGAEYPAVRHILDTGLFSKVKQTVIEVHTPRMRRYPREMSVLDYGEIFQIFHELEQIGFKKYAPAVVNGCCGRFHTLIDEAVAGSEICCYEEYYVNEHFTNQ